MIYETYENIGIKLVAENVSFTGRNASKQKKLFDVKIMHNKSLGTSYTEQLYSLDEKELNAVMLGYSIQNKRRFGRVDENV
jgi:hypothetical protein